MRTLVHVDQIPNASWSADKLIALGEEKGVIFQNKEELRAKNDIQGILNVMWDQVEFEEVQDPVARARSRKAEPPPEIVTERGPAENLIRVLYLGNGLLQLSLDGRPQYFLPGQEYLFSKEQQQTVMQLIERKQKDFFVDWNYLQPRDSLTEAIRAMKESLEMVEDDFGGLLGDQDMIQEQWWNRL